MDTQIGQKSPSVVKEGLLVILGVFIALMAIPVVPIVSIGVGNAVFVFGIVLTIVFTIKKIKKKMIGDNHQRVFPLFMIARESIGISFLFFLLLIIMIILNILF